MTALYESNHGTMPEFDTPADMNATAVQPGALADWLLSQGRHFITTAEAATVLEVAPARVPASLERAREAGKMISITKGGWVPIPPGHRSAGAPPASHYIDQLMSHLGHDYYVAMLSAAAIHGASHQSPMVFQVVTPARLRERRIGQSRIQFLQRSDIESRPRERHTVPMGRITVSTAEVTVFDLVESPQHAGGLSNVATIIGQLLDDEKLDPSALPDVARHYPSPIAQRTGYLLDLMTDETRTNLNTGALQQLVATGRYHELSPGHGDGARDQRWHMIVNSDIEHEL